MNDQFLAGIAGSQKRTDDRHFFTDSRRGCNRKNKRQDDDDHIQKDLDHAFIGAHIFTGKHDGPIEVLRSITFKNNFAVDLFHQFIGHLFFFFLICRRLIIFESI